MSGSKAIDLAVRGRFHIVATVLVLALAGCATTPGKQALPASGFVGIWEFMGKFRSLDTDPVFTPVAQARIHEQSKRLAAGDFSGDYSSQCIPLSLPSMITVGAQEILLDEKKITWVMESVSGIRWIWLDGRELPDPEELRPAAFGHSVGRMEGDELVVESIGFMEKTNIYVNRPDNASVTPGPDMHVLERMRLEEDGNVLVSVRTVTDPKNFVVPWTTTVRYERRPDWELEEVICAENNLVGEEGY